MFYEFFVYFCFFLTSIFVFSVKFVAGHFLSVISKALLDTSNLLHARITTAQNLGRQRLRSRRPFSRHGKIPSNI